MINDGRVSNHYHNIDGTEQDSFTQSANINGPYHPIRQDRSNTLYNHSNSKTNRNSDANLKPYKEEPKYKSSVQFAPLNDQKFRASSISHVSAISGGLNRVPHSISG